MNLTPKQLKVLQFIGKFRAARAYAPTLEEIARGFGVSKITALQHVRALERHGAIRRGRYQTRSIEICGRPDEPGQRLLVAGTIAAGAPIEAIEEREPFLLRVKGDSMIEEQIRDGDYVICERRSTARNGQTVVAVLPDGEATLKRFFVERSGRIRLQPANAAMQPIHPDRVEIRGVVIGVLRKY
jgi:repressor LexA